MEGYMVFDGNTAIGFNHYGVIVHAVETRDDGALFVRERDALAFRAAASRSVHVYSEQQLQVRRVSDIG